MFASRHRLNRVFDLTLTQDAESGGDIHVLQEELSDKSFWSANAEVAPETFLPWHRQSPLVLWEVLSRSADLEVDLERPVLEFLEIDGDRLMAAQLDPFQDPWPVVTFRKFAESALGLGDEVVLSAADQLARVAKAAVRHWLERYVVAAQNLLVDAPHLVSRYWQLMGADVGDRDAWNRLPRLTWDEAEDGPWSKALKLSVKPFVARPVFDDELARQLLVQNPALLSHREPPEFGFAEDVSAFIPFDEMVDFTTDVPGPYQRRWIKKLPGVGYVPATRLLL